MRNKWNPFPIHSQQGLLPWTLVSYSPGKAGHTQRMWSHLGPQFVGDGDKLRREAGEGF